MDGEVIKKKENPKDIPSMELLLRQKGREFYHKASVQHINSFYNNASMQHINY
jgi:hypothetical protein